MLELLLCSMLTILPDYLFRRYRQGKRIGREITLYSVWYELRWGITACLILTVSLITLIFYFHPSTKNVTAVFRTISILPESGGRVSKVFVGLNDKVKAGDPLFQLDSAEQEAARESALRRIAEIDAEAQVASTELAAADGVIRQAEGAYQQALQELETQQELMRRNSNIVAVREIERLQVAADGRRGAVDAALANKETLRTRISILLPAQRASTEAALAQAQVALDKTMVRAGVAGTVQQFTLRPGDVVNPMLRPAGILVPEEAGRVALVAGFGQIETQVMKVGMVAEATCIAKPFTIIPMVVTQVQDVIASGQFRPTDQLLDVQTLAQAGSITVFLEPLYEGALEGVPPGGSCIANAYTSNHDALQSETIGMGRWLFLHVVDAVGLVHAMILRMQAILLPVQTLVFSGGH
jgi:multidrug resistance efflux pump